MKTAIFERPGSIVLKNIEPPTIEKANEVILKIEVASVVYQ